MLLRKCIPAPMITTFMCSMVKVWCREQCNESIALVDPTKLKYSVESSRRVSGI